MSTRNKPDGNALPSVVERFISNARQEAVTSGSEVSLIVQQHLSSFTELVGGYDFSKVIEAYWIGCKENNDELTTNAIRWLRAEYTTKTEARKDLGVRTIIDDASFYDHLKLMSLFVLKAGYKGLLVNLDEMVNLYKLNSTQARTSNYEQLLRMLNDCLQGGVQHLGFVLGGTPEFLFDSRKGLYSYEALQSRLASNSFAKKLGVIDYSAPALSLSSLTPEELYILLKNLRHVAASGDPKQYLVPDEALIAFLEHCSNRVGDAYFRTPRNTIKAFIDVLSVLEQNPNIEWQALFDNVELEKELPSDMPPDKNASERPDDDLSNFTL